MFHVCKVLELKFALGILDFHLVLSRCFKSIPWADEHIQLYLEDLSRSLFVASFFGAISLSVFKVSVSAIKDP